MTEPASPLQRWLIARARDGMTANRMTQIEVAALVGITAPYLSRILTGHEQGTLATWSRVLSAVDRAVH